MRNRTKKPNKHSHLTIARESPTWKTVEAFALHTIATARAILEDPLQPVVLLHAAQGDLRTAKALLKLALPPAEYKSLDEPEFYASGGPED